MANVIELMRVKEFWLFEPQNIKKLYVENESYIDKHEIKFFYLNWLVFKTFCYSFYMIEQGLAKVNMALLFCSKQVISNFDVKTKY